MDDLLDTLIIGGGPGGLTAAVYLLRFRRRIALIDKGHSRAALIPVSHNFPGHPEGVHGADLLENLRAQVGRYGGQVDEGDITGLARQDGIFIATLDGREVRARTVLLATGVADAGLPVEGWHEAVAAGAVRLCPVCDGFDVIGSRVAVVSSEKNPVGHALFLRTFCKDVTLFAPPLAGSDLSRLAAARVRHVADAVKGVTLQDGHPVIHTADQTDHVFDVLYPMLGESARSALASALGAETADCEELVVDGHQQTTVPGLYAVGDVVRGLNQISVAAGQAAVAATAIHNALPPRYA